MRGSNPRHRRSAQQELRHGLAFHCQHPTMPENMREKPSGPESGRTAFGLQSLLLAAVVLLILTLTLQGCFWLFNRDPVAVIEADPAYGTAPLTVHFDGTASHDQDGDELEYTWSFEGGSETRGAHATRVYADPGDYVVQLRVEDARGGLCLAEQVIHVAVSPTAVQEEHEFAASSGVLVKHAGGVTVKLPPTTDSGLATMEVVVDQTSVGDQSEHAGVCVLSTFSITYSMTHDPAVPASAPLDAGLEVYPVVEATVEIPQVQNSGPVAICRVQDGEWCLAMSEGAEDPYQALGGVVSPDGQFITINLPLEHAVSTPAVVEHGSGLLSLVMVILDEAFPPYPPDWGVKAPPPDVAVGSTVDFEVESPRHIGFGGVIYSVELAGCTRLGANAPPYCIKPDIREEWDLLLTSNCLTITASAIAALPENMLRLGLMLVGCVLPYPLDELYDYGLLIGQEIENTLAQIEEKDGWGLVRACWPFTKALLRVAARRLGIDLIKNALPFLSLAGFAANVATYVTTVTHGPEYTYEYCAQEPPPAPTPTSPGSKTEPGPEIDSLSPTLTWTGSKDTDYYNVLIYEHPFVFSNIVLNAEGIAETSYQVPAGVLSSGVRYRWDMQAVNEAGASPVSTTLFFRTSYSPLQPPGTPTPTFPGSQTQYGPETATLTPTLKWNVVSGADHYALAISKYPFGSSNIVVNPQSIAGASYTVPSGILEYDERYRWNMQAINEAGSSPISITLYFQTPDTPKSLNYVSVSGPSQVAEDSSAQYTCAAYFTDGSNSDVTTQASWSENSSYATISADGLLDAGTLSSDRSCTVTASYTHSGITRSGSRLVTLKDAAVTKTLERISISGPDEVYENSSTYYACTAYFTDESSAVVTSQATWSVTTSYATITSGGRLDVGNLTANRSCAVQASYTYNGITKTYSKGIALNDVPPVKVLDRVSVSGPSQVNESSSAYYTSIAYFSDGSSADVSTQATWSENSAYTSISSGGQLAVGSLSSDQSCTVAASYTYNGVTKSDSLAVVLKNVKFLDHVTVSGPSQVDELNSQYYTCTAYFTDGTSSNVSSQSSWTENSPYATITSAGRLDVGSLSSDQSCTITASYTSNAVTKSGSKVVTLHNQDPFVPPTVETLAAQDVRSNSAVLRARITDDGGSGITTRRFEWGTTQACSDASSDNVSVTAQGYEFSLQVTNLQPGQTYYFRARAQNIAGWGSGSVFSFTTVSDPTILPPTVSNWGVQDVGPESAVIAGYIDDYGGSAILERRFEWGRTDSCSDGSTSNVAVAGDSFTYTLTGLEPYTYYYYRASARNTAGWGTAAGVQELRTDRPPVTAEVEVTVTDAAPDFSKGSYSGHPEYWSTDTHEGRTFITAYTQGNSADCWAEFQPSLPSAGTYSVIALFYGCPTNSLSVQYTIHHSGVQTDVPVNQCFPELAGEYYNWREVVVGMWEFDGSGSERVVVTDATGDSYDGTTTINLAGVRFERH